MQSGGGNAAYSVMANTHLKSVWICWQMEAIYYELYPDTMIMMMKECIDN